MLSFALFVVFSFLADDDNRTALLHNAQHNGMVCVCLSRAERLNMSIFVILHFKWHKFRQMWTNACVCVNNHFPAEQGNEWTTAAMVAADAFFSPDKFYILFVIFISCEAICVPRKFIGGNLFGIMRNVWQLFKFIDVEFWWRRGCGMRVSTHSTIITMIELSTSNR